MYVTAAAMQTADASATIADLKSSGSVSNVQLVKGENFITFNVSVANPSLWYLSCPLSLFLTFPSLPLSPPFDADLVTKVSRWLWLAATLHHQRIAERGRERHQRNHEKNRFPPLRARRGPHAKWQELLF